MGLLTASSTTSSGNNLALVEGVGLVSMPPTANLNFPLVLERTVKTTTDAATGCDLADATLGYAVVLCLLIC